MRDQRANNLPYGMQRRLEIARALAVRPQIILLDEPAAGMNEEESAQLSEFIRTIRDTKEITVVIIDHHMDVIMSICDKISVLNFGTLLAAGPKVLLLDEPSLGLAPLIVNDIMEIIKNINKEGISVLLVEQNARKALAIAHQACVLEQGRIVKRGTGKELAADESIIAAYLGKSKNVRRDI